MTKRLGHNLFKLYKIQTILQSIAALFGFFAWETEMRASLRKYTPLSCGRLVSLLGFPTLIFVIVNIY